MLALSQTAGYAIVALSALDEPGGQWRLARDIATEVGVPAPYLSKILHALARAGVIRAKRGYQGGFVLTKPAAGISVLEVVEAVEDRRWSGKCLLGLAQCSDERACPAHRFWVAARADIEKQLRKLTIAEVAKFEQGFRSRQSGGLNLLQGYALVNASLPEKKREPRAKSGTKRVARRKRR